MSMRAFLTASFLTALAGCSASSEPATADEDLIFNECSPGVRKIGGKCVLPQVACGSELGKAVVEEAWEADLNSGSVPWASVYSGRSRAESALVDAIEVFPRMAELIAEARHEVDLETFEWDPQTLDLDRARLLADTSQLVERRTEGLAKDPTAVIVSGLVRLEERLKAEEAAGKRPELPVRAYFSIDGPSEKNPVFKGTRGIHKVAALKRQIASVGIDARYIEVHAAMHTWNLAGAAHSKLLVVDGTKALLTGANPQSVQSLGRSWHDAGFVLVGEAGKGLRQSFDATWEASTVLESCTVTDPKEASSKVCATAGAKPIAHHRDVESPRFDEDPSLEGACLPVFLATRRPLGLSGGGASANPLDQGTPQAQAWLASMNHAERVLKIESPNINAPGAKKAVLAAAKRGVDVRVIVSMGFNAEAERQLGGSNEDSYREMLESLRGDAAACKRLDLRFHSLDGKRALYRNEVPGATHTKYMSVDDQIAVVGSGNQDVASWSIAYETNALIDSAEITRDWDARIFDHDWENAIDVRTFARSVLDGTVRGPGGGPVDAADLEALLKGSEAWANAVLAACPE